ncbi:MAG: hypothetical protein HFI78_04460 [Lachnospiraceae bacterium]|jgi:hypothetical protein|nr:hypothetical protein [Lachnospiraceae bacterium]
MRGEQKRDQEGIAHKYDREPMRNVFIGSDTIYEIDDSCMLKKLKEKEKRVRGFLDYI